MDIQDQNTILIVDDIEMNREILDCIFNKDFKTPQFDNGLDAFLYTKDHADEIVAVLLDITMPVMDGYGYLEKIREHNLLNGVPIFLITAEDRDQQLAAFEYQISDIIEKPFTPAFLLKRVTSQIELFKIHRSLEYKNLLQEREIARKNKEFSELNVKVISTLALSIEFRSGETGKHVLSIRNISYALLHKLREIKLEFSELNVKVISTLALSIEFRSGETGKHVLSIRNISYALLHKLREIKFGECAFLSDEDINNIAYASILHDIGKIAIPDAILNKPGRLTPEEFDIIKTHTVRGAELIKKIGINTSSVLKYAYDICLHHHERYDGRGYPEGLKGDELSIWSQVVGLADVINTSSVLKYAYDICLHHHERYDGRGYPEGLKGDELSIWSQVVGLADVYDALTQERCYKKAFSHETAIEMICSNQCGVFNPALIDVFKNIIDEIVANDLHQEIPALAISD